MSFSHFSYAERANVARTPIAKTLFALMEKKQSNLALSADVLHKEELLNLVDEIGPKICILKTHIDILRDFSYDCVLQLQRLAEKHQFLIFEDRKFADIGQTVKYQYEEGIYHISDWAHLTNAHALPGPQLIESLAEVGGPKNRGLILIAEMSSKAHLMTRDYSEATFKMAEQYPHFVIGFITQHALSQDPSWIYMTPGIHLDEKGDARGQQYATPEDAIINRGIDVIIVGRGLVSAKNRSFTAELYRERGWSAYLARLAKSR
jgi:orotidine 5'-phosphate decarboxylase subfamily 1